MVAPEDRSREAEIQSAQARRLGTHTEHMYAAELHHDAAAAWPPGSPERARHQNAEREHRQAWGRTPQASSRIELATKDADAAEAKARKSRPKQKSEAVFKAAAELRSAAHVLGAAADREREAEYLRRATELENAPPPRAKAARQAKAPPSVPAPVSAAQDLADAQQAYSSATNYADELRATRAMDEARRRVAREAREAPAPAEDPGRVRVPGLGSASIVKRKRKPGRGPNERALLDVHHDAVDRRRAARALGRAKVDEDCGKPVDEARELGAAEVARAREGRDAAYATARAACEGVKSEVRALPTRAERVSARPRVRKACRDDVDAALDAGRSRVEKARADRRARVDRALAKCQGTRVDVGRALDAFMKENRQAEDDLYRQLLAEMKTPRIPRSGKQIAAALAAKQRGRSSRLRRGKTVDELVDEGAADIPDDWQWLWKQQGKRWVREARDRNAQPYELFFEHLKGHGVSDPTTEGPMRSPTYAEEYERRIGRDVDRSEREQAIRETMDALGLSRADAEAYVRSYEKKAGKLSKKAKRAKRPAQAQDDDGIPF